LFSPFNSAIFALILSRLIFIFPIPLPCPLKNNALIDNMINQFIVQVFLNFLFVNGAEKPDIAPEPQALNSSSSS